MKLTFVVHQFLPRYFTGTEQYVFAVARALQANGHDVEVFALDPDFAIADRLQERSDEVVEGLRVVRLRVWYCLDRDFERMEYAHPLVAALFAQHLRQRQPDVVHFFHLRYLGADLIAEAKAQDVPTVAHLMDFWFLCPAVVLRRGDGALCDGPPEGGMGCIDCVRPELGQLLDRHDLRRVVAMVAPLCPPDLAPRATTVHRALTLTQRPARLRERLLLADRILAPSRFLRAMFVQNGYPQARIDVLPYGIDESRLLGADARTPAPAGGLRCGYLGTIAEHKGVDLAVDAVLGSSLPVELAVHGRTTDFADYAAALLARARGEARIRFCGPFERQRLGAVLASIDVLLVPSRWYENTPFVVLEAFAAGVPVVAADLGGLRELVADGQNGELFAPGDAAALRARLERLVREPQRLQRYRQALLRPKSMAAHAVEFETIYRALARALAPGRAPHHSESP